MILVSLRAKIVCPCSVSSLSEPGVGFYFMYIYLTSISRSETKEKRKLSRRQDTLRVARRTCGLFLDRCAFPSAFMCVCVEREGTESHRPKGLGGAPMTHVPTTPSFLGMNSRNSWIHPHTLAAHECARMHFSSSLYFEGGFFLHHEGLSPIIINPCRPTRHCYSYMYIPQKNIYFYVCLHI